MKMMQNLRPFRWNDFRLRNKLMLLYFAAVFIPVMLTNTFFYTITAGNVRTEKVQDLRQSLERNKDNFRKMLEGVISFSSVIYNDGILYSALDRTYTSESEVISAYGEVLSNSINRFVPLNKQFYNAYLFTDNDSLIHAGLLQYIDLQTKQEGWFQATTDQERSRKWLLYTNTPSALCRQSGAASATLTASEETTVRTESAECGAPYLSVIRELDFYKAYSNYHKILRVDILPHYLENTLFDHSFPGEIYLLSPQGHVIYSSEAEPPAFIQGSSPQDKTTIVSPFEGIDYLKGWEMVGIYPNDVVNQSLFDSRKFIIYLTCVNLLFPSIIILLIARSLNLRLGMLLGGIKRVKNQRFEVLRTEPASDEIGQLTEEFNRMTQQINGLIQDVYVAELDRRQAQFNALLSQINPHYLFNTLDAIRMNCVIKGEEETASVIKLLGRGFRRSLSWGEDMIPLQEELAFVTDYLDIQHFRFGHRLSYQLEMDEEVLELQLPKMSILPLVENACIHGIEHSEQPGNIIVSAKLHSARIVIRVSDNGIGMEEEKLQQRLASLEQAGAQHQQGNHVGLKNVYDRLKWHFGKEFSFSLDSRYGEGTTIELQIPAAFAKDESVFERRIIDVENIDRGR
ncbi:sensor histidine kinase [Paenibacillus sp. FSL H8-0537]|uniref:sensor histidine kinase n=1 Tax=Paenibacillus sp. FSL H8-0537 TaxID=2921399 RepID=UPI0031011AA5